MTEYKINDGQLSGWRLRMRKGAPQARSDVAEGRWAAAPLRLLARHYAAGEGPWAWLLEQGVTRPAPSGPSGTNIPEGDRSTLRVRVPRDLAEALGKRWRIKPADAVVRALREVAERS